MFLENDFARPLFDFEGGGKAKAFQCLMCKPGTWGKNGTMITAAKITRTERGMRMHLKIVHDWKEQPCLYSMESQTELRNGAPRKLRAGPPALKSELSDKPDMEKTPPSQKSHATNENELLKLTNEEN